MNNPKFRKFVVYVMILAMVASSILFGLSFIL